MGFIDSYGLFLLEIVTLVAIVSFAAMRVFAGGRSDEGSGMLEVRRLDRELRELGRAVRDASMPRKARKSARKADRKADKAAAADAPAEPGRIFVLDFEGDMAARQVGSLAHEVTALLSDAHDGDEVLVRLSSPGGTVSGYGLGAAQLERIRARGLPLTVAVDKVAASGGYMMAAVADTILATPFAMVGSIGVVGTVPNFRRLLERGGVEVEQHTAGRYKRTLTMVGENDEAGREKFRAELATIHAQFGKHLQRWRPALDIEHVGTGEVWLGDEARDLGLVDAIGTSDDWLLERRERVILSLRWRPATRLGQRIGIGIEAMVERVLSGVIG